MNAERMIAEVKAAGLQLTVRGRNLTIQGVGVRPAWLVEAIRSHKAEVIGVLQGITACSSEERERSDRSQDQAPEFPPMATPLPDFIPALDPEERTRVIDLVMRQGKPAIGWCLRRANAYYDKFPGSSFQDQDAAAAQDLLAWQGK
jgi:hypothetical protein